MNMEVTSVSKKEQKLSQVAAAIFVITPEDIRHSRAMNIPDLLRMVPGLIVAQTDSNTWAISALECGGPKPAEGSPRGVQRRIPEREFLAGQAQRLR